MKTGRNPSGIAQSQVLSVFLCHSSQDKPAVRDLYQRLLKDGFAPWLDEEQLIPGQNWQQEISKAVRSSDVVIVCLSKSSITKEGYVQKEIRIALDAADEKPDGTIFVIPGRLEHDVEVPQRLAQLQWANLFLEAGYQKLLTALNRRAESLGIPLGLAAKQPQRRRSHTRPAIMSERVFLTRASTARRQIQNRLLRFTNLQKIFYPGDGYTKRDVINFYAAVAELLVPHLQNRPLSLKRYPNGIDQDFFFQKDASALPQWLHREKLPNEESGGMRVIVDDKASLLYLANLGCIDQNPYMSRIGSLDHPDFILIDLDPYHCGYDRIVEAAQLVRNKLRLIGLDGYPKTTGGSGLHIYVPVEPVYSFAETRSFAEVLARWAATENPDLFTTPRAVAAREKGKVYFDYLQNARGKTVSAPYVLRPFPRAPVATPLKWEEVVPTLKPSQFHIANALRRFERHGDLLEGLLNRPQSLDMALNKLSNLSGIDTNFVYTFRRPE